MSEALPEFIIPAHSLPSLTSTEHWQGLLKLYQSYARPEVSDFNVACIALAHSGNAYVGVNLEFKGLPIASTVHAEQFAVSLARRHGEPQIQHLIVSAMPCGHCRQFLQELGSPDLPITVFDSETPQHFVLSELLPKPFSLATAGQGCLTQGLRLRHNGGSAEQVAHELAERSYAPYSKRQSGLVLSASDEHFYLGSIIESAAYNPTLTALQTALIDLVSAHQSYDIISSAYYSESASNFSEFKQIQDFLAQRAPKALVHKVT